METAPNARSAAIRRFLKWLPHYVNRFSEADLRAYSSRKFGQVSILSLAVVEIDELTQFMIDRLHCDPKLLKQAIEVTKHV